MLPKHSGGHLLQEAVADERGGVEGSSVLESCVCQALELGGVVWWALLASSFSQWVPMHLSSEIAVRAPSSLIFEATQDRGVLGADVKAGNLI